MQDRLQYSAFVLCNEGKWRTPEAAQEGAMLSYRVIGVRTGVLVAPELNAEATTPEAAAKLALGVDLIRFGRKNDRAARVYCDFKGQPTTMVRLYTKAMD